MVEGSQKKPIELTTNSPQVSEISKEAVSELFEDLLYLYNNITNSELQKEITTQIDINNKLKEKLSDTSENTCKKKGKSSENLFPFQ
ncbi:6118_t:CDS:2 [Diversispora eburnea]|uniref:6118_t:CDS:1 n=1 Tax=Diversispora eburnea TaxID=1213867 RepID=A0A9N9CPX5_9GLOM|nr:6118_t:CDS:2 [Diversispora eburnea]